MKIKVKVKPGSGRSEVVEEGRVLRISLKSNAEDNKANLELIKLLKKYFKKDIKIIKGLKSRDKIVEIED